MRTVSVFLVVCFLVPLGAVAQDTQRSTRRVWIDKMVGDIKVRRGSSSQWVDARVRMPLKESDAIRAFIESEAEIKTSEGSVIKVSENTTLELAALKGGTHGAQETRLKVLNGGIVSDVKKLMTRSSKFEFETPTAVASIRGTRVGLDVSGEQTDIRVYEGVVYVVPKGTKNGAEVNANQMTSVRTGQKTVEVSVLKERVAIPPSTDTAASSDSSSGTRVDTVGTHTVDTAATAVAEPARMDTAAAAVVEPVRTDTVVAARAVELVLVVDEPASGAVYGVGDQVVVRGTVKPSSAQVKVRGQVVKPQPTGQFRYTVPAPTQPGEFDVVVEANFVDQNKVETRKIVVEQAAQEGLLALTVSTPAQGISVLQPSFVVNGLTSPGAEVTAAGQRMDMQPTGAFSGRVTIPEGVTEFEFTIEAVRGSESKTETRIVRLSKEQDCRLQVVSPVNGQVVTKPLIFVSGSAPVGSEVEVGSMVLNVAADGRFSGQIPIPAEEGEFDFDISVACGSKDISESRTVRFTPEIQLIIASPVNGQKEPSPLVAVKGVVKPVSAELLVNGQKVAVMSNGAFTGMVRIEDVEGEQALEFEVNSEGGSASETRTVVFERPNTDAPIVQGSFPPFSKQKNLYFTVIDRTVGDAITFWREIDGSKESEQGEPQQRFILDLEAGIHDYAVWAVDKAGNSSQRVSGRVGYMSTSAWTIRMRKPAGTRERLLIPPAGPGGSFDPSYTVEFTIENLPDDNYDLLQEVRVSNTTTSDARKMTNFTDIDFDFDIDVKRGADNVIRISVRDKNDVVRTQTVVITVK